MIILFSKFMGGMLVPSQRQLRDILLPTNAWSTLASFPGPTKERRGPGTHCLRMRRVPQKNVGHRIPSYT